MMSHYSIGKWQDSKIGELMRIKHGYAFKGEFFSNGGPYIVLTPGNFYDEGGLKLKGDKEKYYIGPFPKDFILKSQDLLVVMTEQAEGLLGSAAFIPENNLYLHNQRLGLITDLKTEKIDKNFLYHLFNSRDVRTQIRASANGTKIRHTSPDRIYQVKIKIPLVKTQQKIATILSTYDDLIENNTRRIKILEEMAQAIYREWFVHFRFPGHEGVRMVESELGLVPEGWEVIQVNDAIIINPKITLPKNGIKPFLSMGCLSENTMNIQTIEYREGNSGSKFQNGDTLFARITPCLENGKTVFVQFFLSDSDIGFGSTEFIVLRSKTLTPEFVYLLSRTDSFRDNAIKSMSGATGRQRVQEECFKKYYFAHPDTQTLTNFETIVKPIFESVYILALKNTNLRRTRDLLLPKLISGEIDVCEVDIKIPAADV